VAIAVFLRGFGATEEDRILRRWENVTFQVYGLENRRLGGANDARAHVGDYVRLAWRITNEKLAPNEILDSLAELGKQYPLSQSIKRLINANCYDGWTEELRYLFFRYEEYISEKQGQRLNQSQWSRIWGEEPSRSIEHIRPQSKGPWSPSTSGIYIHRLGNLLMLPPGVNSQLQDREPRVKAAKYESCGLLAATEVAKLLKRNNGKWSRAIVERRERGLIRWAGTEWAN